LVSFCTLAPALVRAQVPPRASLPPQASERAEDAHEAARERHRRRLPLTLYAPSAAPEALAERRATDVKFTVLLGSNATRGLPRVSLTIRQLGVTVPMLDDGHGPDLSAGDRIYSALVHFSAADARAGRCYDAVASSVTRKRVINSAALRLCVSRLPIGFAAPDTSAFNPITYSHNGETTPALGDEILIRVRPGTGDDQIVRLATLVGGRIVGSQPAQNVYQIRLNGTQTPAQLLQAIQRLQRSGDVLVAVPNARMQ